MVEADEMEDASDEAGRRWLAVALRAQAATTRAQGQQLMASADALERQAARWEDGDALVPGPGVTFELAPSDGPGEGRQIPRVEPIRIGHSGGDYATRFAPREAASPDEEMSAAMVDLLASFDRRFTRSPYFVSAVNQAAAAGLPITDVTAHWIGEQVQEMENAAGAEAGQA